MPDQDLGLATQQVTDLALVCARQRALIAIHEASGEGATEAETLLASFEEVLVHVSERLRQLQETSDKA